MVISHIITANSWSDPEKSRVTERINVECVLRIGLDFPIQFRQYFFDSKVRPTNIHVTDESLK